MDRKLLLIVFFCVLSPWSKLEVASIFGQGAEWNEQFVGNALAEFNKEMVPAKPDDSNENEGGSSLGILLLLALLLLRCGFVFTRQSCAGLTDDVEKNV